MEAVCKTHICVKFVSRSLYSQTQSAPTCPQHAFSVCYRSYGVAAQQEISSDRGHAVLAPFTAARQVTDSNPLVIERSEGVYVYDSNGKKYLDSLAGLWCTSLGGHEPRLIAAATNQMNRLPFYHSFWNRITKPALELSKELLELFTPADMSKVFFTNDGSEANDTQVKLVWYYNNALGRPNKKKIIARQKAYHGSTIVAASLTGLSNLHQSFDLPVPFVLHTDCPHYWRFRNAGESEEDFATRLANNLEQLILKEGADNIAAFIAEPVMGAGGVIPPPATYFDKVQAVLKKHDILFIADEVICAFGRLGAMFGCEKYNIKPDLVTIAKALSSGYMPIGAVLMGPHIAEVVSSQSNEMGSFGHGFTYSGHPVPCAVALETLKIYKERNIVDHVKSLTPYFQEGMREAIAESPVIGEVRGTGLVMGVEFTRNKSPTDLFPASWATGTYFGNQCAEQGLLVRVSGDTIMMSPPLISTKEEIQKAGV
ncbi:hypothetical protein GOP47_0009167 [Adiantum capillus-veneris]|uniref:Uncharacterized protein n=1 Tax=Adiantum capillus-veneris TaxID=13818 RepID=A0A9D4UW85_ADICA|nr:hypothetical protein GOP47_0009167 [Adiantum capillus-veneris]